MNTLPPELANNADLQAIAAALREYSAAVNGGPTGWKEDVALSELELLAHCFDRNILKQLNTWLENNPHDFWFFVSGYIDNWQGRNENAVIQLQKIKTLDEAIIKTLVASLLHLKRNEEALEKIEFWLNRNPKNTNALYYKSWVLNNLNQREESFSLLTELEKNNPDNLLILTGISNIYFDKGEFDKCLECRLKRLSIIESISPLQPLRLATINFAIGDILLLSKKDTEAKNYILKAKNFYSQLIKINPYAFTDWQYLGQSFGYLGFDKIAIDCIKRHDLAKKDESPYKDDFFKPEDVPELAKASETNDPNHPPLPYALLRIAAKDYELFKGNTPLKADLALPNNAQWVFLTGHNGYGKTSLLEAIAIGLRGRREPFEFGDTDKQFHLVEPNTSPKIEVLLQTPEGVRVNCLDRFDFEKLENVVAYGYNRIFVPKGFPLETSNTRSLFHSHSFLPDRQQNLMQVKSGNPQLFETWKKTIESILEDHIAGFDVLPNAKKNGYEIKWTEKDGEGNAFPPMFYENLGTGIQTLIAFVTDLYIQLYSMNNLQTNSEEMNGIVLIDELDNHVHPEWLIKIIGLLSKKFPKVQFIASTHSIIPIMGAPENSVVLNVSRNTNKGVEVTRLFGNFRRMTPNLLYDYIFKTEPTAAGEDLDLADSVKELKERDTIYGELTELLKNKIEIPDDWDKEENNLLPDNNLIPA